MGGEWGVFWKCCIIGIKGIIFMKINNLLYFVYDVIYFLNCIFDCEILYF